MHHQFYCATPPHPTLLPFALWTLNKSLTCQCTKNSPLIEIFSTMASIFGCMECSSNLSLNSTYPYPPNFYFEVSKTMFPFPFLWWTPPSLSSKRKTRSELSSRLSLLSHPHPTRKTDYSIRLIRLNIYFWSDPLMNEIVKKIWKMNSVKCGRWAVMMWQHNGYWIK